MRLFVRVRKLVLTPQAASKRLAAGVLALLLSCAPASAQAADAPSLEEGLRQAWIAAGQSADLVMPPPVGVWTLQGSALEVRAQDAPVPGGEALRLQVTSRTPNPWDAFAAAYTTTDIKAGDLIFVSLWARSVRAPRGEDQGLLPTVLLQENGGNYADFGKWSIPLSADWRPYVLHAVAPRDFRAGSLGLVIHLGRYRQTIEIGPVFALNLGPDRDPQDLPAVPGPQ